MKRFSILVISWDGGSELWEPFAQSFSKYWPDCKLELFLVTQTLPSKFPGIFRKVLWYGNVTWTERLNKAINEVGCENVILFCDDFFLNRKVNQCKIDKILYDFSLSTWSCLQLYATSRLKTNSEYVKRDVKSLFIISTAAALWKSSVLSELTSDIKLSARNFEVVKSREVNSRSDLTIMISIKSPIRYYHAVLEGYWRVIPLFFCKVNGFPITFNIYKRPNLIHAIFSTVKSVIFRIALNLFPSILRKLYSGDIFGKCL